MKPHIELYTIHYYKCRTDGDLPALADSRICGSYAAQLQYLSRLSRNESKPRQSHSRQICDTLRGSVRRLCDTFDSFRRFCRRLFLIGTQLRRFYLPPKYLVRHPAYSRVVDGCDPHLIVQDTTGSELEVTDPSAVTDCGRMRDARS